MIDALSALAGSELYPFHMPGHKRTSLPEDIVKNGSWLSEVYTHDITEIDGFDDLQDPRGMIKDIETRLAGLYGAEKAFLSVNGSTCGNLSAISALVSKGSLFLADEGAHRSVYNAALIGEREILPLRRETIPGTGLTACISAGEVETKLREAKNKNKLPEAVVITSPTYEGFIADTDTIADIVHGYGIPLIVDGAHGAHYTADKTACFPRLSKKADITVVSLHKTLPAMTQAAAVLINRTDAVREIKRWINIFQTTSPSYILMASADACLQVMEARGEELKKNLAGELERLYSINPSLKHLYLTGNEHVGKYGIHDFDKSKINILDRGNMTGAELYDIFRKRYRLQPERCGEHTCLMMSSIMDTKEGFDRLIGAIKETDATE